MGRLAFIAVDPKRGGFWFKIRTLSNFTLCAALCAALIVVFSGFMPLWVANALGIGITLYLFVVLLNKRAIRIYCEHCGNTILSNTPWICGFCGAKNEDTADYPFVYQCRHCSAVPKAYKCHHVGCGELIFLSEDRLTENFAYCINSSIVLNPQKQQMRRKEESEDLEHAIAMAEKEKRLAALKAEHRQMTVLKSRQDALEHDIIVTELDMKRAALERQRERSRMNVKERRKASLEDEYDEYMGVDEAAEEKRSEVREKYKDDQEKLQKALMAVDDWEQRNRK